MKKLYTTLLLLLTASTISSSQVPTLQWVRQIGSVGYDYATSMAVDPAGNVYTTGYFNGTVDFDPGNGVHNLTETGNNICFLSKTDALGNFVWAKTVTNVLVSAPPALTIDKAGTIYVTGAFLGKTDFDSGPDSTILTTNGMTDIFVAKYTNDGELIWARNMGGLSDDYATGIAVDDAGNVVITGKFWGTADFDPGNGEYKLTTKTTDLFIAKLDAAGTFVWAKQLMVYTHSNDSESAAITVDAAGNVYTTGNFAYEADFDPGPGEHIEKASNQGNDIFISKLDAAGNFRWAKKIGGAMLDAGTDIKVDAAGYVYVTGLFRYESDFDPDSTEQILVSSGNEDICVLKLDSNGKLQWAKKMGGAQSDAGYSLTLDSKGNVYTAGFFNGIADFDPGQEIQTMTASGSSVYISKASPSDIFISKLDPNGNYLWSRQLGGSFAVSIGIDATDAIYVAGTLSGIGDFDPGAGQRLLSSVGVTDIFILKLPEVPVSVDEESIAPRLTLYPSPINGVATVQFGKTISTGTLRVLNILGQTIIERTELSGESCTIDLYNQASGMYMVELTSGGEVRRRNLVKE
ncbi:MAG: SBBP repeat-containing protein [Candidatus Kapaibacterium sp.]